MIPINLCVVLARLRLSLHYQFPPTFKVKKPGLANPGPGRIWRVIAYCTICDNSPFLYFSAIFSSGIALILPACPSQPKER
jgi:hypothetical protein